MSFALMIESLVAILLLVTIGYCVILNARLKRLKADEQALKATISELITATEIAGRAVAGLKATAQDADRTLGDRLRAPPRRRQRCPRTGPIRRRWRRPPRPLPSARAGAPANAPPVSPHDPSAA